MLAVAVLIVDIATRKSVGFSILGMVDLNQLAQMACVFLVLPLAFLREQIGRASCRERVSNCV